MHKNPKLSANKDKPIISYLGNINKPSKAINNGKSKKCVNPRWVKLRLTRCEIMGNFLPMKLLGSSISGNTEPIIMIGKKSIS